MFLIVTGVVAQNRGIDLHIKGPWGSIDWSTPGPNIDRPVAKLTPKGGRVEYSTQRPTKIEVTNATTHEVIKEARLDYGTFGVDLPWSKLNPEVYKFAATHLIASTDKWSLPYDSYIAVPGETASSPLSGKGNALDLCAALSDRYRVAVVLTGNAQDQGVKWDFLGRSATDAAADSLSFLKPRIDYDGKSSLKIFATVP